MFRQGLTAAISMAFLLWAFIVPVALAQDTGEPPALERAGPYRVAVKAVTLEPLVADVRFFVWLLDDVTGEPVPEAQVRIRTRNQETGETGWAIALSTPQQPELYRANLHFEEEGVWESVVEISSTLGTVEAPGPPSVVHFEKASAVGGYVFLVTAMIILGGSVYVTLQARKVQRGRQRDQKESGRSPLSLSKS